MDLSLEGKVAIVTGSTSGIGAAIARGLAREGARVIVTGRKEDQARSVVENIKNEQREAIYVMADLLDKETPRNLTQHAIKQWGRLDIVVNNAAMVCNKPVDEITHEDWDRLFQVNVKAPFFLTQAALPWLKRSKGNVVNVSSINGVKNDYNNLVYDTMKAGLNHMTRGLALDLRKDGVRMNAIMPAGIETAALYQWWEQKLGDSKETKMEIEKEIKGDPSVGTPEEVAELVIFLVSEQASWVDGAVIPVEGGFHIR